jgi:hypothetical protein
LHYERSYRPDRARQAVEADWVKLTKAEKRDFLDILVTNLSSADSEFFEQALQSLPDIDGNKLIIHKLTDYLSRYPSPGFWERRKTMISQHFRVEKRFLRKPRLHITGFESINEDNQVSPLRFLIETTPLGLWHEVLGASPVELVKMETVGSEEDLVAAFATAADMQHEPVTLAGLIESFPTIVESAPLYLTGPNHIPPDSPLRVVMAQRKMAMPAFDHPKYRGSADSEDRAKAAIEWLWSPVSSVQAATEMRRIAAEYPLVVEDWPSAVRLFTLFTALSPGDRTTAFEDFRHSLSGETSYSADYARQHLNFLTLLNRLDLELTNHD